MKGPRRQLMGEEGGGVAAVPSGPLAHLLTAHLLAGGERVTLAIKPSRWFIVIVSLPFAAVVAVAAMSWALIDPNHAAILYWQTALFFIAGRVMLAVLQWMGRLYVLTDLRIMRFTGVFATEVYDCPLRRIASTKLTAGLRERVLRLGTILIRGQIQQRAAADWQHVAQPREVHRKIRSAVARSRSNGRARMPA